MPPSAVDNGSETSSVIANMPHTSTGAPFTRRRPSRNAAAGRIAPAGGRARLAARRGGGGIGAPASDGDGGAGGAKPPGLDEESIRQEVILQPDEPCQGPLAGRFRSGLRGESGGVVRVLEIEGQHALEFVLSV